MGLSNMCNIAHVKQSVNGKSQVPCLFIFGDSFNLPTYAKSQLLVLRTSFYHLQTLVVQTYSKGSVISLGLQLKNHKVIVSQIASRLGGFLVSNAPCCPPRLIGRCYANERPCYNRSDYFFWDEVHPTEAYNQLTATRSYYDSYNSGFTYPMDIKNLVEQKTKMELESINESTSKLSASS
ncbi:hypothetical protein MTR_2g017945 [Medicago truncatula]|uniref:Triacylglycerol lipase n=1 Tax=Medicago truncatula TaxID=3880 RepID=A0A072VES0_MEDTR|nr:hypothetical protein MTR_2g017945 [Medicago truncatula]